MLITLPDRLWEITKRMGEGEQFTVAQIASRLGVSKSPQLYGLLWMGVQSGHFTLEHVPLKNGFHMQVYTRTSLDVQRSLFPLES